MSAVPSSPIFDQSYQPWEGKFVSHAWRAPVIAWTAMRNMVRANASTFGLVYGLSALILVIICLRSLTQGSGPSDAAYETFYGSVVISCLLLMPVVGGNLIAGDVRNNAHMMYFSKSILRVDYVAGKAAAAIILLTPAIFLPVLLAGMFPAVSSPIPVSTTWLVRFAAALCALVPIALIPGISICMAISSCTRRAWLAGIGWFAIFAIPWLIWQMLDGFRVKWAHFISFDGNMQTIAAWIIPLPEAGKIVLPVHGPGESLLVAERVHLADPWISVLILTGLTVASLAIVFWRVGNTERRS